MTVRKECAYLITITHAMIGSEEQIVLKIVFSRRELSTLKYGILDPIQ
jgi:hypothetical protein